MEIGDKVTAGKGYSGVFLGYTPSGRARVKGSGGIRLYSPDNVRVDEARGGAPLVGYESPCGDIKNYRFQGNEIYTEDNMFIGTWPRYVHQLFDRMDRTRSREYKDYLMRRIWRIGRWPRNWDRNVYLDVLEHECDG